MIRHEKEETIPSFHGESSLSLFLSPYFNLDRL